MFVKRFAGEKISTGIGKVEGPDQGWEESGPSGSDLGGRDRNTTNATSPPHTARALNAGHLGGVADSDEVTCELADNGPLGT